MSPSRVYPSLTPLAVLVAAMAIAACSFLTEVADGKILCDSDDQCPPELRCRPLPGKSPPARACCRGERCMTPAPAAADPLLFTPTDGARLRARWVETAGGRRTFQGWYDQMLRTECAFATAADGERRCLPRGMLLPDAPTNFSDPACLDAVAIEQPPVCDLPGYVRKNDSDGCRGVVRIFRRGDRVADNRPYWRTATGCAPAMVRPGADAYRVGAELPPAMFVRGRPAAQPARSDDTPLQFVVLEGEDGARAPGWWRHTALGADCTVLRLADGRWHCVPGHAPLSSVTFQDDSCSAAAAYSFPACGKPPTLSARELPGTCPPAVSVHSLGSPLAAVYRRTNAGTCSAAPASDATEYRALETALPVDGFLAFEVVTEPSSERLRPQVVVVPGGNKTDLGLYDAGLQEPCVARSFGGKLRCAPGAAAFFTGEFADAQCTRKLWRGSRGGCQPRFVYHYDLIGCPLRYLYHSLGAEHVGPIYRRVTLRGASASLEECRPDAAAGEHEVLHQLVPVPEEEFPEVAFISPG